MAQRPEPDAKPGLFRIRSNPVRWQILSLVSLLYMIIYLEKTSIAVTAPAVSAEFGLNKAQMGWIFSAFVMAYVAGQIPSGWLADRFGPRRVISTLVPFWSAATLLIGLGGGFLSLFGLRFVTGLGASGTFPITTRAMQPWFRPSERGTIHGISHCCARLGGAVVPPLGVWLTLSFGWQWVFYVCGAVGVAWSVAFSLVYRDIPRDQPWIRPEELALVNTDHTPGHARSVPWRHILCSPNMLFIACGFGCYAYCGYFFVAWLPSYLVEYRGFSMAQMGIAASLPLLAGMAGDVVGGMLGDRLLQRTGRLNFSRRVIAVTGMLGAAAFMIPAGMTESAFGAVACLSLSLFFLEFLNAPSWAVTMDIGGAYSGTVSSLMNMGASIAGSVSPIIFGSFAQSGNWVAPFLIQAEVLVAGAAIWYFLIDAERPIVPAAMPASQTTTTA